MPVAVGVRLGVYEVVSHIGSGGMGEVYRARDTKLGRDVALKILPDSVAHDPERVARFKREAQVLAALNHTHIAATARSTSVSWPSPPPVWRKRGAPSRHGCRWSSTGWRS